MQVMSYAVRGPLAIRAVELEKEIKSVAASLLFMIIQQLSINQDKIECYGHQICPSIQLSHKVGII